MKFETSAKTYGGLLTFRETLIFDQQTHKIRPLRDLTVNAEEPLSRLDDNDCGIRLWAWLASTA